jgi:hypothetical protein
MPAECPICGGVIVITRFACADCDSAIEGRFAGGPLSQLNKEQIDFVETFVRCEGKISRMEGEVGLSYPTIRSRLHEIIRSLGYEPGASDETQELSEAERERILEDLDEGLISVEEAVQLLQEFTE